MNRPMRSKKWAASLIMLSLVCVTAACSGGSPAAPQTAAKEPPKDAPKAPAPAAPAAAANTPAAKPKVTYWTMRPADTLDLLKKNVLGDVLNEVDLDIVSIPAEYENKLRIAISGGSAPDMFDVDGVYTSNYAYSGALMPLDKYWDKGDYDDYVQSSKDKTTYNGKIYAASLFESSIVLYYNKEHFEKAGITNVPTKVSDAWTYDQFLDAAKKLTIRDASGKVTQYGAIPDGWLSPDNNSEGASFTRFLFLWNHGAEVLDPKNTTAKGFLNSDKTIQALQEYQDYYQKYKISPLETISKDQSGFETGKLSMYISNISTSFVLNSKYPNIKYGVMPLPKGEKHFGSSGGWNVGIYAKAKNPDAAWKIINAMTGKEGHKKFTQTFNFMPSRKSSLEARADLNQYPLSLAKEMMNTSRARPVTPAYAEISPIFADMMSAVAYGGNVRELANKAADDIDKVLKKYAQ
ncbi:extracellular solute-binding protein [Paenibacillus thalictri]|uniref:Extracellular solute-binding protein n=1 Tax=Paenibacillus thalictri TaxID=2527873 RepID=A0A4Q9DKX0_9BACL|nr:extracellular solute-binding protein [Paenibacillus thalictri]TBL73887.1 extracellular solute-binding protein [Paenibacillus thalictri]